MWYFKNIIKKLLEIKKHELIKEHLKSSIIYISIGIKSSKDYTKVILTKLAFIIINKMKKYQFVLSQYFNKTSGIKEIGYKGYNQKIN